MKDKSVDTSNVRGEEATNLSTPPSLETTCAHCGKHKSEHKDIHKMGIDSYCDFPTTTKKFKSILDKNCEENGKKAIELLRRVICLIDEDHYYQSVMEAKELIAKIETQ